MMSDKNSLVSVILPCFNEREGILILTSAIHEQLVRHGYNHEIIVVDDNSPDGTYDLIVQASYEYIRAIKRKVTPSLGGSIRDGIEASKGEIIVVMDSDGNHRPEDLPILLANMEFYDCVSASRFVYGGDMGNRFRHLCSWLFNIGSRIVLRGMVTDSLFGYYAIHRDVLYHLNFDKIFWGFGDYCIRLMYYLQQETFSILQIPGVLGERLSGQGNSAMIKTLARYSLEVLKLSIKDKGIETSERRGISRATEQIKKRKDVA